MVKRKTTKKKTTIKRKSVKSQKNCNEYHSKGGCENANCSWDSDSKKCKSKNFLPIALGIAGVGAVGLLLASKSASAEPTVNSGIHIVNDVSNAYPINIRIKQLGSGKVMYNETGITTAKTYSLPAGTYIVEANCNDIDKGYTLITETISISENQIKELHLLFQQAQAGTHCKLTITINPFVEGSSLELYDENDVSKGSFEFTGNTPQFSSNVPKGTYKAKVSPPLDSNFIKTDLDNIDCSGDTAIIVIDLNEKYPAPLGIINSVYHTLYDGDEIKVTVSFYNYGDVEGTFYVKLLNADKEQMGDDSEHLVLTPGETKSVELDSSIINPLKNYDVNSLKGAYYIELYENNEGIQDESGPYISPVFPNGEIASVTPQLHEGFCTDNSSDEYDFLIDVTNTGNSTGQFQVRLYAEDGTYLEKEPDVNWEAIEAGQTKTITITSCNDLAWDVFDVGNSFRVELHESILGLIDTYEGELDFGGKGKFCNLDPQNEWQQDGDEFVFTACVENDGAFEVEYRVYIYDSNGQEMCHYPAGSWENIEPGQKEDVLVDSGDILAQAICFNAFDIYDLGGSCTLKLFRQDEPDIVLDTINITGLPINTGEPNGSITLIANDVDMENEKVSIILNLCNEGEGEGDYKIYLKNAVTGELIDDYPEIDINHFDVLAGDCMEVELSNETILGINLWNPSEKMTQGYNIELWENTKGYKMTLGPFYPPICQNGAVNNDPTSYTYCETDGNLWETREECVNGQWQTVNNPVPCPECVDGETANIEYCGDGSVKEEDVCENGQFVHKVYQDECAECQPGDEVTCECWNGQEFVTSECINGQMVSTGETCQAGQGSCPDEPVPEPNIGNVSIVSGPTNNSSCGTSGSSADEILITVNVTNNGQATGTFWVEILNEDTNQVIDMELDINAGGNKNFVFNSDGSYWDAYDAQGADGNTLGGENCQFLVKITETTTGKVWNSSWNACNVDCSIQGTPSYQIDGNDLIVTANVKNTGVLNGRFRTILQDENGDDVETQFGWTCILDGQTVPITDEDSVSKFGSKFRVAVENEEFGIMCTSAYVNIVIPKPKGQAGNDTAQCEAGDEVKINVPVTNTGTAPGTFFIKMIDDGNGSVLATSGDVDIGVGQTKPITVSTNGVYGNACDIEGNIYAEVWEEDEGWQDETGTWSVDNCCPDSCDKADWYVTGGSVLHCIIPNQWTDDELQVYVTIHNGCATEQDFKVDILHCDQTDPTGAYTTTTISPSSNKQVVIDTNGAWTSLSDFDGCFYVKVENQTTGDVKTYGPYNIVTNNNNC